MSGLDALVSKLLTAGVAPELVAIMVLAFVASVLVSHIRQERRNPPKDPMAEAIADLKQRVARIEGWISARD